MIHMCMGCMREYDKDVIVCPHCGYVEGTPKKHDWQLDPGTMLSGRFLAGKNIMDKGHIQVYTGLDGVTGERVSLWEFLPENPSAAGACSNPAQDAQNCGIMLNRRAAVGEQEGLLGIKQAFIHRNACYAVTEPITSNTLKEYIASQGNKITPKEGADLLLPALMGVAKLHSRNIAHGNIAMDMMVITEQGKIKLGGCCMFKAEDAACDYKAEDVHASAELFFRIVTGESFYGENIREASRLLSDADKTLKAAVLKALKKDPETCPDMAALCAAMRAFTKKDLRHSEQKKGSKHFSGKKPFWKPMIAGLLGAVIIIAGIFTAKSITDKKGVNAAQDIINMPEIVGLPQEEAAALLKEYGFRLTIRELPSDEFEEGTVLYQSPSAGEEVYKKEDVFAVVSIGIEAEESDGIVVQNVCDYKKDVAVQILKDQGFTVDVKLRASETVKAGYVISQSIAAGTYLDKEEIGSITIYVSIGSENKEEQQPEVPVADVPEDSPESGGNDTHGGRPGNPETRPTVTPEPASQTNA